MHAKHTSANNDDRDYSSLTKIKRVDEAVEFPQHDRKVSHLPKPSIESVVGCVPHTFKAYVTILPQDVFPHNWSVFTHRSQSDIPHNRIIPHGPRAYVHRDQCD